MGIPYLSTCRPVNLSYRVDMSISSINMWRMIPLPFMATCQPVLQD